MKITAITCTCDRPEAFALCEKYMARQTRKPDQWIILDDGIVKVLKTHPIPNQQYIHSNDWRGKYSMCKKVLFAIENNLIRGDALIFIEDDDLYFPGWIEWCERMLSKGFDLVGQGSAFYYQVGKRWWSDCKNVRHASLCQTAISSKMFEPLVNTIRDYWSPFFDTRLWALECNKYLNVPRGTNERLVVGIKGMPGLQGYSHEHKQIIPPEVNLDPSGLKLWKLIGNDAIPYMKFYQP